MQDPTKPLQFSSNASAAAESACVRWEENETPVAVRFDDPYYSKKDGRAESHHVFIEGNDLPQRFSTCHDFHIAELGFGTGLNFFQTAQIWRQNATTKARLTYTSFELYPMGYDDIERALAPWPDLLAQLCDYRQALMPSSFKAGDVLEVIKDNLCLQIVVGDANHTLHDLSSTIDAWYLDGFSPAKSDGLWNRGLLQAVGQKTKAGGTFATYTAAGWVRRLLDEAGFDVTRQKGFASKRHMSTGQKRAVK